VWQPLPEGWKEAHDPITHQPYYYNLTTGSKTWARPVDGGAGALRSGAGGRAGGRGCSPGGCWITGVPGTVACRAGRMQRVARPQLLLGGYRCGAPRGVRRRCRSDAIP